MRSEGFFSDGVKLILGRGHRSLLFFAVLMFITRGAMAQGVNAQWKDGGQWYAESSLGVQFTGTPLNITPDIDALSAYINGTAASWRVLDLRYRFAERWAISAMYDLSMTAGQGLNPELLDKEVSAEFEDVYEVAVLPEGLTSSSLERQGFADIGLSYVWMLEPLHIRTTATYGLMHFRTTATSYSLKDLETQEVDVLSIALGEDASRHPSIGFSMGVSSSLSPKWSFVTAFSVRAVRIDTSITRDLESMDPTRDSESTTILKGGLVLPSVHFGLGRRF